MSRALQEKSDCCSELLLSAEQLQRDVRERDEEIETLGARVRELEQTLMHRVSVCSARDAALVLLAASLTPLGRRVCVCVRRA